MKRINLTIGLLLILVGVRANEKQAAIGRFMERACMKHASVGISVIRLADGKTVAEWQPEQSLVPASTLKTLTTATVLRMFRPDYRIATSVAYSGYIKDSVLRGALYIQGGGDPSLGSRYDGRGRNAFFEGMLGALRKAGIKRIEGEVIGDDTGFSKEGVMPGWTWEDMGNYYAAGIYGLNFGDNLFEIVLDTSRKGMQPVVKRTHPAIPGLKIVNRLLSKATSFDSAYIYGPPYEATRYLYGALPRSKPEFTIKGDLPDPTLQTAQFARAYLQSNGVVCTAEATCVRMVSAARETARKEVYRFYSRPLSHLVKQTNVHSLNLYAEGLLRQIAPEAPVAIERMLRYWQQEGLDTAGLFLYDGSGLSPSNRLTAGFLSRLMVAMKGDTAFVASLPIAGKEGTVGSFLKDTPYSGKAYLKSGTIKQVIAYTGYIDGKERYAVTILVNNATCSNREVRKAIEKLLVEMSL